MSTCGLWVNFKTLQNSVQVPKAISFIVHVCKYEVYIKAVKGNFILNDLLKLFYQLAICFTFHSFVLLWIIKLNRASKPIFFWSIIHSCTISVVDLL